MPNILSYLFGGNDEEDQGRICKTVGGGMCSERSGNAGVKGVSRISNDHFCGDHRDPNDPDDLYHGKKRTNPHHCTACNHAWYKA